ncbi:MAG: hypothetical protein KGL57_03445 [Burkholderiales bacterium]|nr:hypothetical protein [Burkholderiales bacterium]
MVINQQDRKKLIWLLKRATSYTAWKRYSDACDAFAKAFEYSMEHAVPEPLLLAPTHGMPDTNGYKYVVDAQINFSKGLAKLLKADRSVFKYAHELDNVDSLEFHFSRTFGPNPDQGGDYVNFDELDCLFMDFKNKGLVTCLYPEYRTLRQPDSSFRPFNFPEPLPDITEPTQDILIKTGDPVPTYGIWEPVKVLSGPVPSDDTHPFSMWHRLTKTAPEGVPVKFKLDVIAAPAYLLQGTEAPGADLDENESPLTKNWEGSPVTWRLLWADDRYLDGTVPSEEGDYFAEPAAGEPADQASATFRLRCEAGQPCPCDGIWTTPAAPGSRHFKQGEIMPDLKSDYGQTIWLWTKDQS